MKVYSLEVGVEVGDNSAETGRGMVVFQGIVDETVVDTTICICQIQPAHGQGAMVLVGLRDGSRQLGCTAPGSLVLQGGRPSGQRCPDSHWTP